MIYLFLILMCIVFVELFRLLQLNRHLSTTLDVSRESLTVVKSSDMKDEEKEVAVRGASLALIREALLFILKFAVIAAGLLLIYLAGVHLAGIPGDQFRERLYTPLAWLLMTLLSVFYVCMRNVISKRL